LTPSIKGAVRPWGVRSSEEANREFSDPRPM